MLVTSRSKSSLFSAESCMEATFLYNVKGKMPANIARRELQQGTFK